MIGEFRGETVKDLPLDRQVHLGDDGAIRFDRHSGGGQSFEDRRAAGARDALRSALETFMFGRRHGLIFAALRRDAIPKEVRAAAESPEVLAFEAARGIRSAHADRNSGQARSGRARSGPEVRDPGWGDALAIQGF
ncbi:MAG: hypothetical protein BroJett003_16550 [Planctomycetota bacterium]|nr:MAG: hypothetical protein BroJett003_16550 [Planctomycetota bacterium]